MQGPSWCADNEKDISFYSPGSAKKGLWECERHHQWVTEIRKVLQRNYGCPFCSNKKLLYGFNDLATKRPDLALLWSSKNELSAKQVLYCSTKKFLWNCERGHEWEASAFAISQLKKFPCQICAGNVPDQEKAVEKLHPEIAKMLVNPAHGSTPVNNRRKQVEWKCELGHVFKRSVRNMVLSKKCPYCDGKLVLPGFNDLATLYPELAEEWREETDISKVSRQKALHAKWQCKKCSHFWSTFVYNRTSNNGGSGCPSCSPRNTSKGEVELAEYISSIVDHEVIKNVRGIIPSGELDIWIPNKKIAIEYNCVYWHNHDNLKRKNYHFDKWKMCKDNGITLYQIWEDEWIDRNEVVKNTIAHKLGVNTSSKIFARKTTVQRFVSVDESRNFLEKNHIQGFASGAYYIGLKSDDKIVALMVISRVPKENDQFEITRYATSKTVVGGFTKILSFFEKLVKPSRIITFSDNCISDGLLYQNSGFFAEEKIPVDYKYVVGRKREHKFNYRKKGFENNPNLLFEDGLSEKQLAILNNIPRIYDAGKIRWAKHYQ